MGSYPVPAERYTYLNEVLKHLMLLACTIYLMVHKCDPGMDLVGISETVSCD